MLSFIIFGLLFIFLGVGVHIFKWHFLISGYNTMSKEKKAKVDVEGLSRLFGIYAYINGSMLILAGIMYGLGLKFVIAPVIIIFAVLTFYVIIKAQRFDGNIFDEGGKLRKGAGKQFIIPSLIASIALIFVIVVLTNSSLPTKVTFQEDGIQIHGMYGELYTWKNIETVKLVEELPTIELQTNGSALGSKLKGYFRTTELGSVKLFVNTKFPPFIYLETAGAVTILNMDNEYETKEIYNKISNEIK